MALLFVTAGSAAATQGAPVAEAAERFAPGMRWAAETSVALDLTCRGRQEFALLGFGPAESMASSSPGTVVVAVFVGGLTRPPRLLRFTEVSPAKARLTVESLDQPAAALKEELGALPSGWRRSATCKGLNLGDGETDAFHLYWHVTLRGLAFWRL